MRFLAFFVAAAAVVHAEIHSLTLRQSVERALKQNPEILIARFDELKAAESVNELKNPFLPRVEVGSGLGQSWGFPLLSGGPPSVFNIRSSQTFYNKPLSYQVAAARGNARGATIDTSARREEVIARVATLHTVTARSARVAELVNQQLTSYERIAQAVTARVEEGRELAVEARAADLRIRQARQRLKTLESERDANEAQLAVMLGFPADDRVRPAAEDSLNLPLPASADEAVTEALGNNKQVRRLESAMQAQQLQARAGRADRYPTFDIITNYAVFSRFNNYEDYFRRFDRNNAQIGMSFRLPLLFAGSAGKAQAAQADLEVSRIRLQINMTRDRIAIDTRKTWQDLQNAQEAREVARLDLDITRERLGVALAQFEEGRTPLRQVEELRTLESEKWLVFFDAQTAVERAQIEVLRQTGTILAALQ